MKKTVILLEFLLLVSCFHELSPANYVVVKVHDYSAFSDKSYAIIENTETGERYTISGETDFVVGDHFYASKSSIAPGGFMILDRWWRTR
jgi:hypothetical protein